jgi:hypothetical protein
MNNILLCYVYLAHLFLSFSQPMLKKWLAQRVEPYRFCISRRVCTHVYFYIVRQSTRPLELHNTGPIAIFGVPAPS